VAQAACHPLGGGVRHSQMVAASVVVRYGSLDSSESGPAGNARFRSRLQMPRAQRDKESKHSRSIQPTSRSQLQLALGARTGGFAESLRLARQEQAPAACAAELTVESGINGLLVAVGGRGMTFLDNINEIERLKRTGVSRPQRINWGSDTPLVTGRAAASVGAQIQINDECSLLRDVFICNSLPPRIL
jgi:hypothetical protein